MSQTVTLGGDRLGAGKKQTVSMHGYERSTHDLSSAWRSSMSAGTLVPFMNMLALPGDSWDIDLECEVMTLPTLGPLFGSFKVQLDVFEIPLRLYQGKLHMNLLGVGLKMEDIKLPELAVYAERSIIYNDNTQINPSCILSYLGLRGLGRASEAGTSDLRRYVNATPLLAYWDIFKQYYSNKMEDNTFVIHNPMNQSNDLSITRVFFKDSNNSTIATYTPSTGVSVAWQNVAAVEIIVSIPDALIGQQLTLDYSSFNFIIATTNYALSSMFLSFGFTGINSQGIIRASGYVGELGTSLTTTTSSTITMTNAVWNNNRPVLAKFPLSNIDEMRKLILAAVNQPSSVKINEELNYYPYAYLINKGDNGYSILSSQEGLAVKTYLSDLFNNWLNNEFVSGTNGINEITSVSTEGDSFTIDALNLASKVYAMLNRIAISGGTYDDWLNAVYTHERTRSVENPIYHGSLIKELAFQEVVSTATSGSQPLGELAGRGRLTNKHKGGRMRIKVHEPSIIMGIVSLTPRVDYSQGNDWTVNLKTFNDFHKPALDAIGFQDLITDQMAWFDTEIDNDGNLTFKSAGKQPAWLNYMTDVNKTFGNFADAEKEMFMTLNRRYESGIDGIQDLTTYIDPVIFNQIFAQPELSAQNFWVQIGKGITVRRKMSAKVIPNL